MNKNEPKLYYGNFRSQVSQDNLSQALPNNIKDTYPGNMHQNLSQMNLQHTSHNSPQFIPNSRDERPVVNWQQKFDNNMKGNQGISGDQNENIKAAQWRSGKGNHMQNNNTENNNGSGGVWPGYKRRQIWV